MEDDAPPGVPEWVVTYGDMMSLLLTFFIMLVSLSEIVAEQKYKEVVQAMDAYLKGYDTAPIAPPGNAFPANSHFESDASLGARSKTDHGQGGVQSKSVEGDDVRIKVTDEGVPQQVGEAIVFQPGLSNLTAAQEKRLVRNMPAIIQELSGKPNKIEIRAHAAASPDARDASEIDPIQLTYERGHTILKMLTGWGIDPSRIRLTAASDGIPASNDPDRRLPDDRVEIYTTNVFTSTYVGPRR